MKCYKPIFIFLSAVLCFLCNGCSNRVGSTESAGTELVDTLDKMDKKKSEGEAPAVNQMGIYVDVTPSMKGFLGATDSSSYKGIVEETKYAAVLRIIAVIISSSSYEEITEYRVDAPLWIAKENVLVKALDGGYYTLGVYENGGNEESGESEEREESEENEENTYECIDLISQDGDGYKSWCLANTFENCYMKDDFSIIITDLYENERMVSEAVNSLKKNMDMKNGSNRTVGIIGLKSEFSGTIYDFDKKSSDHGIEYGLVEGEITEEDIVYRQFYIIAIGNPERIQEFFENFKKRINLNSFEERDCIFYERTIYGMDYRNFEKCCMDFQQGIFWTYGSVRINNETDMDVYDYNNSSGRKKDIVVSYKVEDDFLKQELAKGQQKLFPFEDLSAGVSGDLAEKEMVEVPCQIGDKEVSFWRNGKYELDGEWNKIFDIEKVYYSPAEELLYVWFSVSGEVMPKGNMKLNCQISMDDSAQVDWGWVEDWNLPDDGNDLGKTKNLTDYFEALQNKLPVKEDVLLNFTFYLNNISEGR